MRHGRRGAVAWGLTAVTAAAGCGPALSNPHDHGGAMVDEYRPARRPVERPAPASAEYVLWQWQPVPVVTSPPPPAEAELLGPATRPAGDGVRWVPVLQRVHVYVHHGQPVGFRRRPDGQLVAVAGPTTRPLTAGHYCWHMLASDRRGRPSSDAGGRVAAVAGVGLVVVAVAGVVAAIWAIDHNDRHAHLGKTIGNLAGGGVDAIPDAEGD